MGIGEVEWLSAQARMRVTHASYIGASIDKLLADEPCAEYS